MSSYENDWQARLKGADTQAVLAEIYTRALTALEEGDQSLAHELFGEIVEVQPDYKDAALYVWLAREGTEGEDTLSKSCIRRLTGSKPYRVNP